MFKQNLNQCQENPWFIYYNVTEYWIYHKKQLIRDVSGSNQCWKKLSVLTGSCRYEKCVD